MTETSASTCDQPVRIAVIGACGFIGRHIVQSLGRDPAWHVRAVARAPQPTCVRKTAAAEWHIADARDCAALVSALRAVDIVVHAVAGAPSTIRRTVLPVYRAAEQNRCRRIVYIGTAVVHGQSPPENTVEETPLPAGQRLPYNRAKLWAERKFFALARRGSVEVTVLRPGIVYGPGSRWISETADALLAGRAGLVEGGGGFCNAIHVSNVVHAVRLAALAPSAAGEAFLLGEEPPITWREFYCRIADPLGIDADSISVLAAEEPGLRIGDLVPSPLHWASVRALRSLIPVQLWACAARIAAGANHSSPCDTSLRADLETTLLQRARHLPNWNKARELLGYRPVIGPSEAWRDTIEWLASAGYPVTTRPTSAAEDICGPGDSAPSLANPGNASVKNHQTP